MTKTQRIKFLDKEHMSSSEDEKKFEKLNKIAGKYKKEEVYGKFKSPMLGNMSASSESEEEKRQADDESEEDLNQL